MGIYEPRVLGQGEDGQAVLERGFDNPIGAPRLREMVSSALGDDDVLQTKIPRRAGRITRRGGAGGEQRGTLRAVRVPEGN